MSFWLMATKLQACTDKKLRCYQDSGELVWFLSPFLKIKHLLLIYLFGEQKNWTLKNVTEEWSVLAGVHVGATFKPNLINLLSQKHLCRKSTNTQANSNYQNIIIRPCLQTLPSTRLLEQSLLIKTTKGIHHIPLDKTPKPNFSFCIWR